ncbi:MAG: alpha/beta hydrolase [Phycisphaerae bacterium]|nr:alpha/beta hydrolase [Phycisphaerae bacterium]MDP7290225.1 alpha/beta hydrolase [Phycisphaerae bacterium]
MVNAIHTKKHAMLGCLAVLVMIMIQPTGVQGAVTSKNNRQLKAALKKYPAADTNKDGVLTLNEARAHMTRVMRGGGDKGNDKGPVSKVETVKKTDKDGMTTITNAKYGSHQRQVMDLWLPKSDKPTAIVMYIHGGGFVGGDKSHGNRQPLRKKCLDAKVAFATMNYRFKQHASFQEIMLDGARAIQSLRANAKQLNIDSRRIGVYGHSAGAIMSLWLGFHPDVGKPSSRDLLAKYSSKVRVVGGLLTPTGTDALALRYASRGDPPVFQYNKIAFSETQDVHHPRYAVAVQKKCVQLGVRSVLLLKDGPKPFTGDPVAAQAKFFFKYLGVIDPEAKKAADKSGKKNG